MPLHGEGEDESQLRGHRLTTQEDRWEAALSYRAADGKLKRRCSYHPCREEADRALTRTKADRDGGIALDGDNPTLVGVPRNLA